MTDIPVDLTTEDGPDTVQFDDLFPGLGVPYDLALVGEDDPVPPGTISDWLAAYNAIRQDDPEA